jgi:L-iditol 2-dehydrogenase
MRVARLYGTGDIRIEDGPRPVPRDGERLLRVAAVGVCGSDLHWFEEGRIGNARLERPVVLGHEFVGTMEDGQRVIADPAIPCGACELCVEGHPNLCEVVRFAGHGHDDGALREYMAWPERCLCPLPPPIADPESVMLEPLGVAIHAVDLAHVRAGVSVAVLGCGPIGLLVAQVARAAGACRVAATERASCPERIQAAKGLELEVVQAGGGAAEVGALRERLGGWADVTIEAAGNNAAVETAIAVTRPGGRVALTGIPSDDRTSFCASVARRKGLTLVLVRRMKPVYARAIRLVESGKVRLNGTVTHRFTLDRCQEAFEVAAQRRGLKVVVEP